MWRENGDLVLVGALWYKWETWYEWDEKCALSESHQEVRFSVDDK